MIQIIKSERVLDSPSDFTYECEDPDHKASDHSEDNGAGFTPDYLFPQREEVIKYNLNPAICLNCQEVELI